MSEVMARELIEIRGLMEKALIFLRQDKKLVVELFLKKSLKKLEESLQREEY